MKILIVRITGGFSGAEVYNLNLLKALKKYKDINLTFITNHKIFFNKISELINKSVLLKIPVKEIGTKKDFLKAVIFSPYLVFKYIQTIKGLEREGKFDVVCLQSMTEKIFLTPFLKLLSYKVLWIEHGPLFCTNRAEIIKQLYVYISRFTDKILAVSKDTESDLLKGGVSKEKISVVYIGVDTKEFSPLLKDEVVKIKKSLDFTEKDTIIGFLGSVSKEKGIEEFIQTSKLLLDKGRDFRFLIIGEGKELHLVKEQVKTFGIEEAYRFVGFKENVKEYLGVLDILFFPSRHFEGLSISLIESLSIGVPIISTDIGGNREVVENDVTGVLYDSKKDLKEVADLIFKLSKDKKDMERMKGNARKLTLEKFDISRNIDKFYSVFKSL